MNPNCDQLNNIVDISVILNDLLHEYYNKTKDINFLLEQDNEESIIKINQILLERETIINRYNSIKEKYERERPKADEPDLDLLIERRRELLGLIRAIELSNLCKSNELFDNCKDKIRGINTGKKAIQAYGRTGPLPDSFFVDKRK